MSINITVVVEGQALVVLKWPAVPRVGDHITVGANPERRRLYEVVDVLFHGESEPRVDLVCEEAVQ